MNGPTGGRTDGWRNEKEHISDGLNQFLSPVWGRAVGEAVTGCFLQEEIVEMPLRVCGGI